MGLCIAPLVGTAWTDCAAHPAPNRLPNPADCAPDAQALRRLDLFYVVRQKNSLHFRFVTTDLRIAIRLIDMGLIRFFHSRTIQDLSPISIRTFYPTTLPFWLMINKNHLDTITSKLRVFGFIAFPEVESEMKKINGTLALSLIAAISFGYCHPVAARSNQEKFADPKKSSPQQYEYVEQLAERLVPVIAERTGVVAGGAKIDDYVILPGNYISVCNKEEYYNCGRVYDGNLYSADLKKACISIQYHNGYNVLVDVNKFNPKDADPVESALIDHDVFVQALRLAATKVNIQKARDNLEKERQEYCSKTQSCK